MSEKALENRKAELDEIIKDYENKLAQYEAGAEPKSSGVLQLQEEIQATRLTAGLLPVKGPGIEIVLNDRKRDSFLDSDPYIMNYFIVHDSDMLHVINELRGAGAEAIAINGTRIMATSRISCGGPTINVGKSERFTPPFVIHAIGNPDELMAAFQREDSIYHSLAAWGLEFHIRRMDSVEIPRYIGDIEFTYAKAYRQVIDMWLPSWHSDRNYTEDGIAYKYSNSLFLIYVHSRTGSIGFRVWRHRASLEKRFSGRCIYFRFSAMQSWQPVWLI